MLPAHSFLRAFGLVLLIVLMLHAAVAALYLAKPKLFYYRAWEYFFMWSNTTVEEDSTWQRVEYSDLGHMYFFRYQEARRTNVSTDEDGFRTVPDTLGAPRIFVQGKSNVFGSGVSDNQTYPWQLAEKTGIATFNGGNGSLLSSLSRTDLDQVQLIVDIVHERHLAKLPLARRILKLPKSTLQPYKPIASQNLSRIESMRRPLVMIGWWLPDIVARQWQRLLLDFEEYRLHGTRDYLVFTYTTDGSAVEDVIALMETRRRVVEALGYDYLAMIIPSRQTIYRPVTAETDAQVRGERIASMLEEGGFPLVNLFPTFVTDMGPELYFRYDTHWNSRGQALAAELTREEIGRRWPGVLAGGSAEAKPAQQASQQAGGR